MYNSLRPPPHDIWEPKSYNQNPRREIFSSNLNLTLNKIRTIFDERLNYEPFKTINNVINAMDNINLKYMSKKYLDSLITNLLNFTNMETLSDRQSDVFKKYYLPFFYDSLYGFGFEFNMTNMGIYQ